MSSKQKKEVGHVILGDMPHLLGVVFTAIFLFALTFSFAS